MFTVALILTLFFSAILALAKFTKITKSNFDDDDMLGMFVESCLWVIIIICGTWAFMSFI